MTRARALVNTFALPGILYQRMRQGLSGTSLMDCTARLIYLLRLLTAYHNVFSIALVLSVRYGIAWRIFGFNVWVPPLMSSVACRLLFWLHHLNGVEPSLGWTLRQRRGGFLALDALLVTVHVALLTCQKIPCI